MKPNNLIIPIRDLEFNSFDILSSISQNSNRKVILYDAPAGAGKTYALCKLAVEMIKAGERIMFVQPTKDLIIQTIDQMRYFDPQVNLIQIDDTTTQHVIDSIMQYLREADSEGQALLITHAAFLRLPYVHRPDRWHLFIDEVLQSHQSIPLRFKHTHLPLTSVLKPLPIDQTWSQLEIQDKHAFSEFQRKMNDDDALKSFEPVVNFLKSSNWAVFVNADAYDRLITDTAEAKHSPQLFMCLKPSICAGYKSVRIAGARLDERLLLKLWQAQGVQFDSIKLNELKYENHINCERVTIYYGFEHHWSKTLRDGNGGQAWNSLTTEIKNIFQDHKFLFSANNDQIGLFRGDKNAIRLPNSPHGMNSYMHVNRIAFLSALNLRPQYAAFLTSLGLIGQEIIQDIYYNTAYQAIMRGGLRDHKGTEPQTIVVPDQGLAEWLQSILPGSKIEWLRLTLPESVKGSSGRPRIYKNNAEKTRAYRERISTKDHRQLLDNLISKLPNNSENELVMDNDWCYERPYVNRDTVTRFRASIWESKYSKSTTGIVVASSSTKFIDRLKSMHQRRFSSKESNGLFSIGLPAWSEVSMRGLDNVILANGILLDNDGGGLTPQEFAEFLPTAEMVIFNSYSSTPAKPRWRAYIPTECIMTKEIYKNVIERIFAALDAEGFNEDGLSGKRMHGFDVGKKSAADLMYLPCQAAHPDGSFFLEFREPSRRPLDPRSWINFDNEPESFKSLVQQSFSYEGRDDYKSLPQVDIENELYRWRTEGDRPHNRNTGWTALYFALVRNGIPGDQIEAIMMEEAHRCGKTRVRDQLLKQLVRLRKKARR